MDKIRIATPHILSIHHELLVISAKIDLLKGEKDVPIQGTKEGNIAILKEFMNDATKLITKENIKLALWKRHPEYHLDTERLKSELPEIYKKYLKSTTKRPFKYK